MSALFGKRLPKHVFASNRAAAQFGIARRGDAKRLGSFLVAEATKDAQLQNAAFAAVQPLEAEQRVDGKTLTGKAHVRVVDAGNVNVILADFGFPGSTGGRIVYVP